MLFLYLDESGDLGFDFLKRKSSKFFTVTILAVKGTDHNRRLIQAVQKTLARKLNPKGKRKRIVEELKGTKTNLEVKKFFYALIQEIPFKIYSLSLNKQRVYENLRKKKDYLYNYISGLVLDKISVESSDAPIYFYLDKCKGETAIIEFNSYITKKFKERFQLMQLKIEHKNSKELAGLQAVDLFSSGIFRKYEREDFSWYNLFAAEKVVLDTLYLPPEKQK